MTKIPTIPTLTPLHLHAILIPIPRRPPNHLLQAHDRLSHFARFRPPALPVGSFAPLGGRDALVHFPVVQLLGDGMGERLFERVLVGLALQGEVVVPFVFAGGEMVGEEDAVVFDAVQAVVS